MELDNYLTLLDHLLAGPGDAARRPAPPGVADLDPALRATLVAFADCDLNAGRAARRLQVHPNTVHYRLRRIEQLTGRDTRRFRDLVELMAAIHLQDRVGSSPGVSPR